MNLWLTLLAGGLITFLTRLSFIAVVGRWQFPAWVQRALRYVPPAVLCAIIFPEVLMHSGSLELSLANARLPAALAAALVAWRWRNATLTVLAGLLALWVFTLLGAG